MRDTGACKSRMHHSSYGNRWTGNDRIDPWSVDMELVGHRRRSISEYKGLWYPLAGTLPVNRSDLAPGPLGGSSAFPSRIQRSCHPHVLPDTCNLRSVGKTWNFLEFYSFSFRARVARIFYDVLCIRCNDDTIQNLDGKIIVTCY